MELKGKNLSVHYGWIVTVTIFLVTALVKMTWLAADMTATIKQTRKDDTYIMSTVLPDIVSQINEMKTDLNVVRNRQNIVYERMAFRDSTQRIFETAVLKQLDKFDRRMNRAENHLKLSPLGFQNYKKLDEQTKLN